MKIGNSTSTNGDEILRKYIVNYKVQPCILKDLAAKAGINQENFVISMVSSNSDQDHLRSLHSNGIKKQ